MTKSFSVTKNGVDLDPSCYTWDEKTRSFSTTENGLVIEFSGWHDVTFKTGGGCTFSTSHNCTFDAGDNCTFDTGYGCTFNTNSYCTFRTGSCCTFTTGSDCNFRTGSCCNFRTGSRCTFDTGSDCVIVRRDIFEVIQPEPNVTIKLNEYGIKGYKIIENKHVITIDGKAIELSQESFESLKNQLCS